MKPGVASGILRGRQIYWDGEVFRYMDNNQPTKDTWMDRPCGHCGFENTKEGHDGCLGTLPSVSNACCGHGDPNQAYIQFSNGSSVYGHEALARLEILKTERQKQAETQAQLGRMMDIAKGLGIVSEE